jgi:putative PIN family toxin of toxin-antitoxin system
MSLVALKLHTVAFAKQRSLLRGIGTTRSGALLKSVPVFFGSWEHKGPGHGQVDTGFYVAASLKNGYARSYLIGRGSKFLSYQLYSSESVLLELQRVLEDTFHFERSEVVKLISDIRKVVAIVHPTIKIKAVRDPNDDKVLECALEAKADIILAFDKDLLSLKEYEGVKIIHPSTMQYMFPENV